MERQRKFLIASHGKLASGVKSSLDIIIGKTEHVFLIEAYVDQNKSIDHELNEVLAGMHENDELVIFTDLLGGSITNQMTKLAMRPNFHLVAGFNLALLVEVMLADTDARIEEVIEMAIRNARQQIVYVNQLIDSGKNV